MFNFLNAGDEVETTAGRIKIVGDPMPGGEGNGYKATLNGKTVFYKQFKDLPKLPSGFADHQAVSQHRHRRTQWLVGQELYRLSPALNAPFAESIDPNNTGYVCAWIDGLTPWSDWRDQRHPYAERLAVVGQLATLIQLLHHQGVSHGDINGNNVCLLGQADHLQVVLIDFGNSWNGDPGMQPLMSCDIEHISPWLFAGQGSADYSSDLYSLGVMLFEALLVRTIDSGMSDVNMIRERRARGTLSGDPLCGVRAGDEKGLPYASLSPVIQTLVRGLLAPDPALQPTIDEFKTKFDAELPNVVLCTGCGHPYWWHVGLVHCPCCQVAPVPAALHLSLPSRRGAPLPVRQNLSLGRQDIGNPYFSEKHVVIQPTRLGLARVFVIGRNGMQWIQANGAKHAVGPSTGGFYVGPGDALELQGTRITFQY